MLRTVKADFPGQSRVLAGTRLWLVSMESLACSALSKQIFQVSLESLPVQDFSWFLWKAWHVPHCQSRFSRPVQSPCRYKTLAGFYGKFGMFRTVKADFPGQSRVLAGTRLYRLASYSLGFLFTSRRSRALFLPPAS